MTTFDTLTLLSALAFAMAIVALMVRVFWRRWLVTVTFYGGTTFFYELRAATREEAVTIAHRDYPRAKYIQVKAAPRRSTKH
jgi:hypothetical protein